MRIAVTGGIGSGKSFVCRRLSGLGIDVYDCDSAAKRLMRTSSRIRDRLKALVGECVYDGGRLDKAVMARFLLESEEHAEAVSAIVHPAVAEDFEASGKRWMECAILFESGFDRLVDITVCVVAPEDVRIERIMRRDGITREKALEWIARQMPQEEVARRCTYTIVNDGKENIENQINNIINKIRT